jgi:hypothetical protein
MIPARPIQARIACAGLTALAFASLPLSLAAQDLTDAQRQQILSGIKDLEMLLNDGSEKNNQRARQMFEAALADPKGPIEFYLEAKKIIDFDETGRRESDWKAWRDANEDRLKSPEHVAARRLQLRYLILTLDVVASKDREKALAANLPALAAFIDDMAGAYPDLGEQRAVLRESVLDSDYAERTKIDLTVDREAEWVFTPGDVGAIYDRVVLPHFREPLNFTSLMAAWDKRIAHEGLLAVTEEAARGGADTPQPGGGPGGDDDRRLGRLRERFGGGGDARDRERAQEREEDRQRDVAVDTFKTVRLPELQWARERDALEYGPDKPGAFARLTSHIRENLSHPSAQAWLSELRGLAEGKQLDETEDAELATPEEPAATPAPDDGLTVEEREG